MSVIATDVFHRLLKVPAVTGGRARDEIDGFRLFLVMAEKDRLEALNPPNVTPQVFERFLPYAIALDCENQWSKRFEMEAAAAAAGTTPGSRDHEYMPAWYSGRSFDAAGAAVFVSALGASMAVAAAAAASAPGSSSGGEGGGSSGGGRGGGGGSGW